MSEVKQCKRCGFMSCGALIDDGLCPICATERGFKDILLLWGIIIINAALWIGIFYMTAKLGRILGELL